MRDIAFTTVINQAVNSAGGLSISSGYEPRQRSTKDFTPNDIPKLTKDNFDTFDRKLREYTRVAHILPELLLSQRDLTERRERQAEDKLREHSRRLQHTAKMLKDDMRNAQHDMMQAHRAATSVPPTQTMQTMQTAGPPVTPQRPSSQTSSTSNGADITLPYSSPQFATFARPVFQSPMYNPHNTGAHQPPPHYGTPRPRGHEHYSNYHATANPAQTQEAQPSTQTQMALISGHGMGADYDYETLQRRCRAAERKMLDWDDKLPLIRDQLFEDAYNLTEVNKIRLRNIIENKLDNTIKARATQQKLTDPSDIFALARRKRERATNNYLKQTEIETMMASMNIDKYNNSMERLTTKFSELLKDYSEYGGKKNDEQQIILLSSMIPLRGENNYKDIVDKHIRSTKTIGLADAEDFISELIEREADNRSLDRRDRGWANSRTNHQNRGRQQGNEKKEKKEVEHPPADLANAVTTADGGGKNDPGPCTNCGGRHLTVECYKGPDGKISHEKFEAFKAHMQKLGKWKENYSRKKDTANMVTADPVSFGCDDGFAFADEVNHVRHDETTSCTPTHLPVDMLADELLGNSRPAAHGYADELMGDDEDADTNLPAASLAPPAHTASRSRVNYNGWELMNDILVSAAYILLLLLLATVMSQVLPLVTRTVVATVTIIAVAAAQLCFSLESSSATASWMSPFVVMAMLIALPAWKDAVAQQHQHTAASWGCSRYTRPPNCIILRMNRRNPNLKRRAHGAAKQTETAKNSVPRDQSGPTAMAWRIIACPLLWVIAMTIHVILWSVFMTDEIVGVALNTMYLMYWLCHYCWIFLQHLLWKCCTTTLTIPRKVTAAPAAIIKSTPSYMRSSCRKLCVSIALCWIALATCASSAHVQNEIHMTMVEALTTTEPLVHPRSQRLYADSGATCFIETIKTKIRNFVPAICATVVKTAQEGGSITVEGKGNVSEANLKFPDVRYCPKAVKRLASVGRICDMKGGTYEVLFKVGGFEVRSTPCTCNCKVESIGSREEGGGLFFFTSEPTPNNNFEAPPEALNSEVKPEATDDLAQPQDVTVRVVETASTSEVKVKNKVYPQERVAPTAKVMKLHYSFGHLHLAALQKMARVGMLVLPQQLSRFLQMCTHLDCEHCYYGKAHRGHIQQEGKPITEVAERLSFDIKGPFQTKSQTGKVYFLDCIDSHSGFVRLFAIKHKNDAAALVRACVERTELATGKRVKEIQSDRDKCIVDDETLEWMRNRGIRYNPSPPYVKEHNGAPERNHRTVTEAILTFLHQSGLPLSYWEYAMHAHVYVKNRVISRRLPSTTNAATVFYNKVIAHQPFQPFGCRVTAFMPDETRPNKVSDHAEECVMLGYDTKGSYILERKNGSKISRKEGVFYPTEFPRNKSSLPNKPAASTATLGGEQDKQDDNTTTPPSGPTGTIEPRRSTRVSAKPAAYSDDEYRAQKLHDKNCSSAKHTKKTESEVQAPGVSSSSGIEEEEERKTCDPQEESDARETVRAGLEGVYAIDQIEDGPEPATYKEALVGPEATSWIGAIKAELTSHFENGTWEPCLLPPGRKAIGSRWIFKRKRDVEGNVCRWKGRLVAQGFKQTLGLDYKETFSPTVRFSTIRLFFALVAQYDWSMRQADVCTAYLIANLEEDIYMKPPEGTKYPPGHVVKLKKSLYGLKQAGRCWNKNLDTTLKRDGFAQSSYDPCLYLKHDQAGKLIAILVCYVDDLLIGGTKAEVTKIEKELTTTYKMTCGDVNHFLGMRIVRDKSGKISLSQDSYIKQLLARFNMTDCNPVKVPGTDILSKKDQPSTKEEKAEMAKKPYRQLIGALQYLAVCTRPDIVFSVNQCSRFLENPGEVHWQAGKKILKYLHGTTTEGIAFERDPSRDQPKVEAWSDSDWGGDKDDRRSVSGYIFKVASGPVSWKSKKQSTTALSSCEAELMALTNAVCEALWMRGILIELGVCGEDTPIVIREDNRGAKAIAEDKKFSDRTKHIAIRHFRVQEEVASKKVKIESCATADMAADIFTKPLASTIFNKIKGLVGVTVHALSGAFMGSV